MSANPYLEDRKDIKEENMAKSDFEVFELSRNYDPRFDGFDFAAKAKSLLGNKLIHHDFRPSLCQDASWKPNRLKKLWKPQKVERKVRPFNDFPRIDSVIPVFSRRGVDALRDLLEVDGEILELVSDSGKFYA